LQRNAIKAALAAIKRRDLVGAERSLDAAISEDASRSDAWLLRGLVRERRGVLGSVEDLRHAISLGPTDPQLTAQAADILRANGHLFDAREAFAKLVNLVRPDERASILRRLANFDLDLGWYRDGIEEYRRALALAPTSAPIARELMDHLLELGDSEAALGAASDFAGAPAELVVSRSRALVKVGRRVEAQALANEQLVAAKGDPALSLRAAALLIEVGSFEAARRALADVIEARPNELRAQVSSADLAAWAGDETAALGHIGEVLRLDSESASAFRIRGKLAVLRGDFTAAASDLAVAREREPDEADGLIWSGELARRSGDYDAAIVQLQRGIERSRGYPLGAHVSLAAALIAQNASRPLDPDVHRELLLLLAPLLPPEDAPLLQKFEHVLAQMHGNRSSNATVVSSGVLTALDLPAHSRFDARAIQELLRTREPGWVVSRLRALADARPGEPTVLCHLGEVELWCGDYDAAEGAFLAALEASPSTRWAYVGMCAAELGRARFTSAIEWCARGEALVVPGRTQYVYRGEAHRRLGNAQEARADLRRAIELNPNRISAWLNLALLEHEPDLTRDVWEMLRRSAEGLSRTACAELGVDPAAVTEQADSVRVFEHVLTMMRGNRSSNFVVYFNRAGQMRFVPAAKVRMPERNADAV
jgi:tetratricopeptide (TPR) repeat protein